MGTSAVEVRGLAAVPGEVTLDPLVATKQRPSIEETLFAFLVVSIELAWGLLLGYPIFEFVARSPAGVWAC